MSIKYSIFHWMHWLAGQYAASRKLALRFYIEVGVNETAKLLGSGPEFREANRHFRDVLQAKGYPLSYREIPGASHEPVHWRNELADGLVFLTSGWLEKDS